MSAITDFFRRLLKRRAAQKPGTSTSTLRFEETPSQLASTIIEVAPGAGEQSVYQTLRVATAQSVGKQRIHNEDALFTWTPQTGDDYQEPIGFYVIADGMGGQAHGDLASQLAIQVVSKRIKEAINSNWQNADQTPTDDTVKEFLINTVKEAHQAVVHDVPGGGTTLTAVLILGRQMIIAHVGDTRLYQISPDKSIQILTRDHSLVKRLVELHQITEEEAVTHPQRNVLYRALGQSEPLEVDLKVIPLPDCGYLLLCTDGLWGVVQESEMVRLVCESSTLDLACQHLIAAANEAGGPDNISVILVALPA